MLRQATRGTILLLTLACGGAPRGDGSGRAGAAGAPDSVPCVPGDRMPRLRPDTTRDYTLRVVPPDTTRRYAMREYRVPLCPPDSGRAPAPGTR